MANLTIRLLLFQLFHYLLIFSTTIGPDSLVSGERQVRVYNRVRDSNYRQQSKMENRVQISKNRNAKPKPIPTIVEEEINQSKIPKVSMKSKFFEPIVMRFPDTSPRIGADALAYKKELLKNLPKPAQKDDQNIIMTGESCARGLGSWYRV